MAIPLPARRGWPIPWILLFWVGTSPAISGDQPDLTYRTRTNEVRLAFSATDQNDHGVATLKSNDFAVVDTGFIVRDYQSFTRSDYSRLEIAVLIDSSESVTPRYRKEISDALTLLSDSAGVPEENISLLSFQSTKPALLCSGDCRSSNAVENLPASHSGGLTPLFDSIVFASDLMAAKGDAQAEKVLIVFSDGNDTISLRSLTDARDSAVAHNVQIYGIAEDRSAGYSPGTQTLRALAAATGGRCFKADNGAAHALNLILEDFRASYVVSYHLPTHARGFHTVQILPTHNLNLKFRSRSGYYYPDYIR
ncbi:MAG TPA: VWA domain-containing protein [Candidatus Eisenbacteria bacterium]|nr:VWA domain-containing protein [Candidatus Eisenbacteria bacterium]